MKLKTLCPVLVKWSVILYTFYMLIMIILIPSYMPVSKSWGQRVGSVHRVSWGYEPCSMASVVIWPPGDLNQWPSRHWQWPITCWSPHHPSFSASLNVRVRVLLEIQVSRFLFVRSSSWLEAPRPATLLAQRLAVYSVSLKMAEGCADPPSSASRPDRPTFAA